MSKRSMISRKHKKFTYLIIIVFLISIFGGLFSNFHSTQRSVPGSGQGVANLGQEYFIGNNESLGTKPAYSSILHGTGFLMSSLEQALEKAEEHDDSADILQSKGNMYYGLGNYEQAASECIYRNRCRS
ncbi:MAG: hypothetical protein ACOX0N_12420 [Syntrophomonadaceae bacterium]|jgi:hypothetical protein